MADMRFIRLLLSGERLMLTKDQFRGIDCCEKFPAFNIESLLEYCREHLDIVFNYLPDNPTPQNVARDYLLNVD